MPSSLLPPRHGWKHPAVTGRHHPRTARTPRNHTGCASLVHNRVQRVDLLQTSAFFPPCFPPANPPSPSHGFHSRSILLPVGSRFFCWAASSWLLWSSGGIIVVAMAIRLPCRPPCHLPKPPDLPSTKAARKIGCLSLILLPRFIEGTFIPLSSYVATMVGLCTFLLLRLATLGRWKPNVHLFQTLSVYVAPTSTFDTYTKETPIVPRFQTLLTKVKAHNPHYLQSGVCKNTPKLTLLHR